MTNNYYFDTDCLSSFIKANREDLLASLYSKRMFVPWNVYREISRIDRLKRKMDILIKDKHIKKISFNLDSKEYKDFSYLIDVYNNKYYIGEGEAACIALAKNNNGVLASNNLKDIKRYIDEYKLKHLTSADILKQALKNKFITKIEGNNIWRDMLNEGIYLPYDSFDNYINN